MSMFMEIFSDRSLVSLHRFQSLGDERYSAVSNETMSSSRISYTTTDGSWPLSLLARRDEPVKLVIYEPRKIILTAELIGCCVVIPWFSSN